MPDLARRGTKRDDAAMKHGALPETRYVKTDDGVYIGYQVFGEGPYDLVLNDGWMGNVDANWDLPMYARFLAKLGKRARVVMFDRRGFGISDRPSSLESMSLEMGMDDMRTVMDAAGCERAVVYGFEDGCAVSLLFAASYPERTRGAHSGDAARHVLQNARLSLGVHGGLLSEVGRGDRHEVGDRRVLAVEHAGAERHLERRIDRRGSGVIGPLVEVGREPVGGPGD